MKNKIFIFLTLILLFTTPITTLAYLEDYSPFTNWKPKSFPLKELKVNQEDAYDFVVLSDKGIPRLKIFFCKECKDFLMLLTIYDERGNILKDSMKLIDAPYVLSAYAADLNGDRKKDFVVSMRTVASGLGVFKTPLVFVLSSKDTYEVKTITDWVDIDIQEPLRNHFISLKKNGRAQFIHTSLAFIENKRGNTHSYWIYNILEFRGTDVVFANHLHPVFPKCVWYTIKPNHKRSPIMNRAETLEWSKKSFSSFFWSDR